MKGNGHQASGLRLLAPADAERGDGMTGGDEMIGGETSGVPARTGRPVGGDVADLVAFLLGAIGLAVEALTDAIRQAGPQEASPPRDEAAGVLRIAAFAGLGLTAEAARRAAGAADRAIAAAAPTFRFVAERTPLGAPVRAGRRRLEAFGDQARAEQRERERLASAVVEALIPQVASAVVDRIDIDGIVRGVDIPAVVDRVEVNAIVAKADLDRIVDRLDFDAIVARIDLNAIVSRIDMNAIVEQVDIQAIIDKLDLPTMTKQVMDEVDIGEIIRESTGSITGETVDAIRYQGMNADRLVSRVVDRVLFRKGDRDVALPLPPTLLDEPAPAPAARPAPAVAGDPGTSPE